MGKEERGSGISVEERKEGKGGMQRYGQIGHSTSL